MVTIKLELGIAAQKFAQQIQLHNQDIEKQIEEGIKLAMEDLTKDNYLVEAVREATKEEILKIAIKMS